MADNTWPTRRAALRATGALAIGAAGASAFGHSTAAAAYPDRPVRIVVPFAAGGPSDLTARLMSVKLAEALGQTFFVENRAGAGSNLGTAAVARATSSLIDVIPEAGVAMNTLGDVSNSVIGAKSLTGSYGTCL